MNPDPRPAYIGIDIGGTNLRLALVDERGEVIHRVRFRTDISLGRETFFSLLGKGVDSLLTVAGEMGLKPVAVGAGVAGLVSNDGYIYVSVNLRPLDGVNLGDKLHAMTGLSVIVANDVNAFAFGEKTYGAGRDFGSFLMVTLGTGVGGGLVLDGRLWTGIDGVAGEFGHMTVEPGGRPCTCGNHGCLEQYASATALMNAAREAMTTGGGTVFPGIDVDAVDTKLLADLARKGNGSAMDLFSEVGRYLGIAFASVANLLNLEAVILGGGVAESFDLLEGGIRREILSRAFPIPAGRLRVVRASLGDDGGLLGSAALAMVRFGGGNK